MANTLNPGCVPPVTVYNFEVEDFHTYHVGVLGVLLHNANCTSENVEMLKEHLEGTGKKEGTKMNGSINGTHNKENFLLQLEESGGKINSSISCNAIKGVERIEYITKFGKRRVKTVYNSNVISIEEFTNRGLSAIKNKYIEIGFAKWG